MSAVSSMKASPKIVIIGAGPAGLALSRCLKARGIPSKIYDKSRGPRRYGYSIILDSYAPFLSAVGLESSLLHNRAAVRASPSAPPAGAAFRVRRAAFEDVLREGCDIQYEHDVTTVRTASSTGKREVEFANDKGTESADLVIAADGTHSAIRAALFPNFSLTILPQVAFNGKRKVTAEDFGPMQSAFESADLLTPSLEVGSTLLQAYINEYSDDGGASISYTLSRPAPGPNDPCHKPNRAKAAATDIPPELFTEVEELMQKTEARDLEPWKSIFNVDKMKQDRLLHWLMRSGLPPQEEVEAAVDRGVVFMGDALLTSPIIGSRGANVALEQAVELADAIDSGSIKQWVTKNFARWRATAKEDLARL